MTRNRAKSSQSGLRPRQGGPSPRRSPAKRDEGGFIRLILIIIVIIVILSLFKLNLRGFIDEKVTLKENFVFIGYIIQTIWEDYIIRPAQFLWFKYIKPMLEGQVFSGLRTKLEERSELK